MTPQEELFAEFFNKHTMLVKDMSILELREHREKMALTAFEGKAAVYAADEEEKRRKKKSSDGKPTGFERSLETDGATSDAINKIKDRTTKLSKADRIKENLLKLGVDPKFVDKVMSAKNIADHERAKAQNTTPPEVKEPGKPVFNPFEKKDNNNEN